MGSARAFLSASGPGTACAAGSTSAVSAARPSGTDGTVPRAWRVIAITRLELPSEEELKAGEGAGERLGRWSRVPGPPLTDAQQRALQALVELCPEIHHEAVLRPIADRAGMPPGPASLALKGLERRRMAWRHD